MSGFDNDYCLVRQFLVCKIPCVKGIAEWRYAMQHRRRFEGQQAGTHRSVTSSLAYLYKIVPPQNNWKQFCIDDNCLDPNNSKLFFRGVIKFTYATSVLSVVTLRHICFVHPIFRFWFLVTFGDEVMKIRKYYVIMFVYFFTEQGKMGKTEI